MRALTLGGLVVAWWLFATVAADAQGITEKVLLDNEWVTVAEVTVPANAAGTVHANTGGPEIGYVMEGTLTVITISEGRRTQRSGELLWLPSDTIHKVQNDLPVPAKALVILLKPRP